MRFGLTLCGAAWFLIFGVYTAVAVGGEVQQGKSFALGFLSMWPGLVQVWTLPTIAFCVLGKAVEPYQDDPEDQEGPREDAARTVGREGQDEALKRRP